MKGFFDSLRDWVKTLPPPLNALAVIFGLEIGCLILFFAFATLLFIAWAVLHPYLWPKG